MKTEMRRRLAGEPFEEKLKKVARLVALRTRVKEQSPNFARPLEIRRDPVILSAIRRKSVLKFIYNGKLRTVEPQTYGLSTTGRNVLRAYERPALNSAKHSGMAKLFDVKKISGLRESGETFREALPAHNPDDSAMVEIFATLPPPPNQPIKHENMS